jgi:Fe-S-cluster containining protein
VTESLASEGDAEVSEAMLRFSCTQCGACCNRNPEVGLSEAADLADVFLFRLMFRLYRLPRFIRGYGDHQASGQAQIFQQQKKLLTAFSAMRKATKVRFGDSSIDHVQYLVISAMPLDMPLSVCACLREKRCDIYDRRPMACRSVPFHYSRPTASLPFDLAEFVSRPGHECDTGPGADLALIDSRIVDETVLLARKAAVERADGDRAWAEAIVHRMKSPEKMEGSCRRCKRLKQMRRSGR